MLIKSKSFILILGLLLIWIVPAMAIGAEKEVNKYIQVDKTEIQKIEAAATAYLNAWSKGDFAKAYANLSEKVQKALTEEQFVKAAQALPAPNKFIKLRAKVAVEVKTAIKDKAAVAAMLFEGPKENKGVGPTDNDLIMELVKEKDAWKVTGAVEKGESWATAGDAGYPCNWVHPGYWVWNYVRLLWEWVPPHCSPYAYCCVCGNVGSYKLLSNIKKNGY